MRDEHDTHARRVGDGLTLLGAVLLILVAACILLAPSGCAMDRRTAGKVAPGHQ